MYTTIYLGLFNNWFAHKVPKIYVTKQSCFEASKFFNLPPLSTVLIHGNGLFTAQLCLLTFYAAAFSLGKYEKWRNINLVKLHANSIALLEKTQFFAAWFLQKSTEDFFKSSLFMIQQLLPK